MGTMVLRVLKSQGYLIVRELYFDFIYPLASKILFYWLIISSKFNITPFPGEPRGVIVTIRTKKEWESFWSYYHNYLSILKKEIYHHPISLRYRLVGVRDVGNIVFFFKKL
jgi:hypothetical protein